MSFSIDEEAVLKAMSQKEALQRKMDVINTTANSDRSIKQTEIEAIETQRTADLAPLEVLMATAEAIIVDAKDVVAPK